jgi:hypothetical protein
MVFSQQDAATSEGTSFCRGRRPRTTDTLGVTDPDALAQLKRDLAVVVSAEAPFFLTDLCGLAPDAAVTSAVRTATTVTEAAVRAAEQE